MSAMKDHVCQVWLPKFQEFIKLGAAALALQTELFKESSSFVSGKRPVVVAEVDKLITKISGS